MTDEHGVEPASDVHDGDLHLLFVEDSPDDMELFLRRLRKAGYSPEARRVDSVDELRTALETDGWHAAIVDFVIPGFSGREALALLNDEAPDLPAIVASGHAPEEVVAETARLGAVDYLLKDDLTRVVPAVEHAVRERRFRLARRRSDRRLRERERTLSTLFSNLPGMVYRCANDREWTMEFVSDGVRDVLAYEPADLLPDGRLSWGGLIHEDDRPYVWETTEAAVEAREAYTLTYRMHAGDGSVRWVRERGRPVHDGEGSVQALEGFVLDVTEQRQAELDLEDTRARLERLLTASNAVLYAGLAHPPWPATFLGANIRNVLGYSSDDVTADPSFWLEHVHPDHRSTIDRLHEESLERGHATGEYRFVAADGSYRWLHDELQLIRDSRGTPTELVGQFWDVTERREAEEELRASEQRLKLRNRIAGVFLTETGEDVFQAALRIVVDEMDSPHGLFGYLDDDGALVVPRPVGDPLLLVGAVEERAEGRTSGDSQLRLPAGSWDDAPWAAVLATGAARLLESSPPGVGSPADAIHSVAAPIAYAGNVLGVLAVAQRSAPYREEDVHALDEVASYMAPILRQWLERTAFETALVESQEQLALRTRVADALLTAPDDEVFGRILEILQDALDSPLAMFGHLDDDGDLVTPHMSGGIYADGRPEAARSVVPRSDWEGSPWGAALSAGTTQVFSTPDAAPEGHIPIQAAVAVPLIHAEEVLGVICLANRPTGYDREHVATLEALAAYVAPVLQARLRRSAAEKETASTLERLRRTVDGIVTSMGTLVDMRDPYTAGHERRVASLAVRIAEALGYSRGDVQTVRLAARVHDVGKMAIPAEILSRPGRLQPTELSIIQTHPQVGYDILSAVEFDAPIAKIVLQHHERLDGTGYPHGISGDEILPAARVLAVADVVEAMASHRPYRAALGLDVALAEIESNAGALYDADVVAACLEVVGSSDFSFD